MVNKRVLLVATADEVCVLAERLLERTGVDVDCAASAAEAVMMLMATPYTVVAVDRTRTGSSDEELLTHLSRIAPPRPVVIVTSPNKLNDRLDPSTVDLVVPEPVDAHTFVGVILACVADRPIEQHLPTTHTPLPFDSAE